MKFEEVKQQLKSMQLTDKVRYELALGVIYEQAEQVQELEQKLKYAETDLALAERLLKNERRHKLTYRKVARRYQGEKNRYREALKFYANPKIYFPQDDDVCSLITMDYGGKARRELEDKQ